MSIKSRIPKDFYKLFNSKYMEYYQLVLLTLYEESGQSYSLLGLTEDECQDIINEEIAKFTMDWSQDQFEDEGELLTRSNMASIMLRRLEEWGWLHKDYDETLNQYVVSFPDYSQMFVDVFQRLFSEDNSMERESILAVYSHLFTYSSDKEKNNDILRFILSFIGMSVFVIIVGVLLANVIIHFLPLNDADKSKASSSNVEQGKDTVSEVVSNNAESNQGAENAVQGNINTSFMAIQCGYFANEGYAKEAYNKVANDYGAFIYNDADKFKVLAGVYTSEEGQAIMDKLTANGIECAKVSFDLNARDKIQSQIAGIFDGYLNILDTAFNGNVKFVDTSDFKSWVKNLENISEGDKSDVLTELKNHVSDMATEIKKEDVAGEMQYLYAILLKIN